MSTKRGPSAGPVHRDASFRPSLAGQSGARHHLDNNQSPPRASILSKNHNRMVSDGQIRARTEAALALKNAASFPSSQPTMAELAGPSGKQPRNGGMSTRQIIEERNRVRKARSRPTSATTTDHILGTSNPIAGNDNSSNPNASKDPSPEKTVSETLAWVRAKSAERRSMRLIQTFEEKNKENLDSVPHLREHAPQPRTSNNSTSNNSTSNNSTSNNSTSNDSTSNNSTSNNSTSNNSTSNNSSVEASIARGQAILRDAESNIDYFEKYMQVGQEGVVSGGLPENSLADHTAASDAALKKSQQISAETDRLLNGHSTQHEQIAKARHHILKTNDAPKENSASGLVMQKVRPVDFDTVKMYDKDGYDMADR